MRWLQWASNDLARGLGGVEVHARSLARELARLGHEAEFSSDPREIAGGGWDVVHTHGSGVPWGVELGRKRKGGPLRVHTLHGTTLGRMAACREWAWPGGYLAYSREIKAGLAADVVMEVRPGLPLARALAAAGKTVGVCWNGWDSEGPDPSGELPPELAARIQAFNGAWLFVGRGDDRMKNVDRILPALDQHPELRLIAVPGDGFPERPGILKTGRLSSAQVKGLMTAARGFLLPSRYEGHSIALLEALSEGLPVVATRVGGVPYLPEGVEGLVCAKSGRSEAIAEAIQVAMGLESDPAAVRRRAEVNRALLPAWKQVAEYYLETVARFRERTALSR